MLAVLVVLIVTNVVTAAALVWLYRFVDGGRAAAPRHPDPVASAALDAATPAGRGTRRLITIEVLNPIELAATRGRLAGLAGSLAPRLTRRIVADQVVKILEQQLAEQQVVADVHLHTLRPRQTGPAEPTVYTDEVAEVELDTTEIVDGDPDEPSDGPDGRG